MRWCTVRFPISHRKDEIDFGIFCSCTPLALAFINIFKSFKEPGVQFHSPNAFRLIRNRIQSLFKCVFVIDIRIYCNGNSQIRRAPPVDDPTPNRNAQNRRKKVENNCNDAKRNWIRVFMVRWGTRIRLTATHPYGHVLWFNSFTLLICAPFGDV